MQAVILAAGQGSRLRPLTDHRPKCLVEVRGKPMLQYQLEALCQAGVRRCVIVVGHHAEQVRAFASTRYRSLAITYVKNEVFDTTNNIYSLWLARHEITEGMLLLESDLVFEPELLLELCDTPWQNVAVVDRFQPFMNGTVILGQGDTARAMVLKKDQGPGFDYASALKTVNIYKLCHQTVRDDLMPALDDLVSRGLTDHYYETSISQAVADGSMRLHVLRTGPHAWTEIDTVEDLMDAESTHFAFSLGVDGRLGDRLAGPSSK